MKIEKKCYMEVSPRNIVRLCAKSDVSDGNTFS